MKKRALSLVLVALSLSAAGGLAACGGKGDDGATNKALAELASVKDERDRLKNALDTCTKQFAEYKAMTPTGPQEILVRVDGNAVTVVGKIGKSSGGIGELTEAEQNVIPLVLGQIQGSRNSIQQCYVQALKTTAGLENRAVNLAVTVKVNPTGAITDPGFSPQINENFDKCMSTVAGKWKITAYNGRAFPVQANIKLQPVQ
jgi:hypothetical protein